MNMTDLIAATIFDILESHGGSAQIQRNELAQSIGCVPSQINYVITSRFTPERGYIVKSKRGGGGYIQIERISDEKTGAVMHIVNSVGNEIDEKSVRIILENMIYDNILDRKTAKILLSALTDHTLNQLSPGARNVVRASIFKSMLINTI